MQIFFLLPALLILLAALLWYTQAHTPAPAPPPNDPPEPKPDTRDIASLTAAVTALQALMEHPALGGPGFLTVRFYDSHTAVTVQYPNIQEVLYRRVIRQELTPADLLSDGFPEALLALSPEFEAESGGMMLVTVSVSALAQDVTSHHSRRQLLNAVLAELRPRFPGLSIRVLGGELILTPVREMTNV